MAAKIFVYYVGDTQRYRETFLVELLRRDTSNRYRITMFHNGHDALDTIGDGVHPDILVGHTIHPRLSGNDLVSRARAIAPDLPIILLSLGSETPDTERGDIISRLHNVVIIYQNTFYDQLFRKIEELTANTKPRNEFQGTLVLIDPLSRHEQEWTERLKSVGFKVNRPTTQTLVDAFTEALGTPVSAARVVIVAQQASINPAAIVVNLMGMVHPPGIQKVFAMLRDIRLQWPQTPLILIDPPVRLIRGGIEEVRNLRAIPITDSFPEFTSLMIALQFHGVIK